MGEERDQSSPENSKTSSDPAQPDATRGMESAAVASTVAPPWKPPSVEELDALFPGYQITQLLGRGGMGAVYKGIQESLNRPVAIKILPEVYSNCPDFAARFRREAQALANLNHPNIVQIFDFGQTSEGYFYIVMEYVDGEDLHQVIHTHRLDELGALHAVSQICDALQYAHSKNYIHRDIKPANIFLSSEGQIKVGDFGLAKLVQPQEEGYEALTMTGVPVGTPDYISPEQRKGIATDHRTDIYSLGVMFYEMLTGEIPRGAFTPPSKKVKLRNGRLDKIVFKSLQERPENRYQQATEVQTEVDKVRKTEMRRVTPRSPLARLWIPGSIGLLAIATGALAYFSWKHNDIHSDSGSTPLRTTPFQRDQWNENLIIPPADYLGDGHLIEIGDQENKKIQPDIVVQPGTRLENIRWLLDEGSILAQRVTFVECELMTDLGGRFVAHDSLFLDTITRKGGGWFVKYWSSRWELSNCVFARKFFPKIKINDIGWEVQNCTFYDIEFPAVSYQADAGAECADPNFLLQNCRFVNCRIPYSFLIATDDCVFERCEFTGNAEDLPGSTPRIVRLFEVDSQNEPPRDSAFVTVVYLDSPPASAGTRISHVYDQDGLRYAE